MAKDILQYQLPRLNPQIRTAPNVEYELKGLPLDGKLVTSTNPLLIGKNFRTMTNMRYEDNHPSSIMGMTKINTSALDTYRKVRSAYHFEKSFHAESHLLMQAYNTGLTASGVACLSNTIPNTGNVNEVMYLDVAPATAWAIGDTITGATSLKTCTIIKKLSTLSYVVTGRSGTYTDGEVLTNGSVTANQGAGYPTFTQVSMWTDSSGAGTGMFAGISNGQVVYANGVDVCIWGGFEQRCAAIISSTATLTDSDSTPTNPQDLTVALGNDLETEGNIFTVGGSSTLKFYAQFNGTNNSTDPFTETVGTHTVTPTNGAKLSTTQKKFGVSSGYCDGTNDYFATADHADFSFSTAPMTISFQHYQETITEGKTYGIIGQLADANNYWYVKLLLGYNTINNTVFPMVYFKEVVGGVTKADYTFGSGLTPNVAGWHHYEIGRRGTTMYAFRDGAVMTKTETTAVGAKALGAVTADLTIGLAGGTYLEGYIDEVAIWKGELLHSSAFTPPTAPYQSKVSPHLLIGTTRPAEGFKFYLETVNSTASTATVKTFNGASWVTLTATDFTSANGVTLAQDGSIIFDSTVGVSKQKYIEGYYLFWYLVSLSAGTATISHITADLPFQNIIDVWDGNFRDIAAAYKVVGAAVTDITLNVSNYSSYIESDTGSYANLNLLASTSYLEVGFTSKQTALYVAVPDSYTNSTAATVSVYAWDGFSYKSVSSVSDGTLSDGKSLARSGVIAWTNADIDAEQKKTVAGSFPLYFYKIQWSATLGTFWDAVRIYYIGGIPTSNDITNYSFGIMAADRLMLGCNNSYSKNSLIISAQDRPEVFNGTDTQAITFGQDDALMCGAHVFAQYSSNIYNIVLMFKAKETWILQWNQSSSGVSWSRFCISPNIGCPAPRTLCTASVIFEKNLMQAKSVAIWRAHDGIYISNGQSPLKVSEDIKDVFDPNSTTKVNTSMVANEYSFIDEHRLEYHWCWASGSSTTLDKEYVLDLNTWQWFTIDRGSGKYLQCGVKVADTYGTKYTYGFIDTGYIERLEYGTTLDGSDITSTLQFGEMIPIEGNLMAYTMLEMANLICIKKATNSTVTMTVYLDGLTSGTDYTFTISDSTHAYANVMKDIFSAPAIFYGIKLVHVSNAETKGFEPLALTFYYQKKRAHTR